MLHCTFKIKTALNCFIGYGIIDKLDVLLIHAFVPAGMQSDLKMLKLLSERSDPHAAEPPPQPLRAAGDEEGGAGDEKGGDHTVQEEKRAGKTDKVQEGAGRKKDKDDAGAALSSAVGAPHSMGELFIFMGFTALIFTSAWLLVHVYNPWFFHLPPYGPSSLHAINRACADYDAQHFALKEYPNRDSSIWIWKLFSQLTENTSQWTEESGNVGLASGRRRRAAMMKKSGNVGRRRRVDSQWTEERAVMIRLRQCRSVN